MKYVNMAAKDRFLQGSICLQVPTKMLYDDHCTAKDQSTKPRNAIDFKNTGIVHMQI